MVLSARFWAGLERRDSCSSERRPLERREGRRLGRSMWSLMTRAFSWMASRDTLPPADPGEREGGEQGGRGRGRQS